MYNGVKKFFILNNFLKEIDKVDGSNFFELKKEEIEKANQLISDLYITLLAPRIIKFSEDKTYTENKDKSYVEDFEELLKDFHIPIDLNPSAAFDMLDDFIYKFRKHFKEFKNNVRFKKSTYSKGYGMYSSAIEAVFDFELNLISFHIDTTDFTDIINNKIPLNLIVGDKYQYFHREEYHKAFRNYYILLKDLKKDLGMVAPEEKREVLVKENRYNVRIAKVSIKSDGYFSSKDLFSKNPKIVELTELKKNMLKEYTRKIKEFEEWKENFEKDMLNPTFGLTKLEDIEVDDEVYVSSSERLIRAKIIKIEPTSDGLLYAYKIYDTKGELSRKEYTSISKVGSSTPFYKI